MDNDRYKNLAERILRFHDNIVAYLTQRSEQHANRRSIIILLCAGAVLTLTYLSIIRPPDNFPINELVTIDEGMPLKDISVRFEKQEVVRSALSLRLLVVLMGHQHDVHAGDYLFKEPKGLLSIARAISVGAFGLEPTRIRIPEGATTKEMALIFEKSLLRFDGDTFLAQARPLEGYLFPDTYFFLPNASEDLVIRTMRQNFDTKLATISDKVLAFGKPLKEIVIMASLLEREARKTEDRKKIAGVLWNRLKLGMLLQVDAAFLYTIGRSTYQLTTEDLRRDSPYNTYVHKGLPPGPIGSPGLNSLEAAVTPAKHKYLFYLADRSGVTHYSVTYAEHLRKKNIYIY